jgi:nucleoside-diphosphate-sugar epimerase
MTTPARCAPLLQRDLDHVVSATAPLWRELNGARLFFTGGTGFIGIWLLETYLAARERYGLDTSAVVLTRRPEEFKARAPHVALDPSITLVEGDVRSFSFPEGPFEFIIHAATDASAKLNDERPLDMFDTIVAGTHRALEFAVAARARRFLFISSGAVYGRLPPEIDHVDEEWPGSPSITRAASAYGEGKRAAEVLCAIFAHGHPALEIVIARSFALVGPHLPLDIHFAMGNFIRDAMAGQAIEVQGDGTPRRSYLYAGDLTVWLWKILFQGMPMRPYNVGSERSVSILETAQEVAKVMTPQPAIVVAQTADPAKPAERYVPDTSRVRSELGLTETVDLADGIARTIEWNRLCATTDRD